MTSLCGNVRFTGLFERAVAASMPPPAVCQPDMGSFLEEELTLTLSAQLEDRQVDIFALNAPDLHVLPDYVALALCSGRLADLTAEG
jgi:hypothetical protein